MKRLLCLLLSATMFGEISVANTTFSLPAWESVLLEMNYPNLFDKSVSLKVFRDPQSLTLVYLASVDLHLTPKEIANYPLFEKKHYLAEEISTANGYYLIFEKDSRKCKCKSCNLNPITLKVDYFEGRTTLVAVIHQPQQKEDVRNVLGLLEIR
jgi:hypothetical protein